MKITEILAENEIAQVLAHAHRAQEEAMATWEGGGDYAPDDGGHLQEIEAEAHKLDDWLSDNEDNLRTGRVSIEDYERVIQRLLDLNSEAEDVSMM